MAEVLGGIVRLGFVASRILYEIAFDRREFDRYEFRDFYFKGYEYAQYRFGRWKKWVIWCMLIDTNLLMQVSDIINHWNDEELQDWSKSVLGSFSAIGVAGSVLAAVDITALTLGGLSDINWTVRAIFMVSLATSVLSVVFGSRLQRRLYMIGSPLDLRLWLSNGEVYWEARQDPHWHNGVEGPNLDNTENLPQAEEAGTHNGPGPENYDDNDGIDEPLESSIHAIRILQLPVELFAISCITFVVALILYTTLMWRQNPGPNVNDYRNIMICLLLVVLILVGYYELIRSMKDVEGARVKDFTTLGKFTPRPKLRGPRDGTYNDVDAARFFGRLRKSQDLRRLLHPVADRSTEGTFLSILDGIDKIAKSRLIQHPESFITEIVDRTAERVRMENLEARTGAARRSYTAVPLQNKSKHPQDLDTSKARHSGYDAVQEVLNLARIGVNSPREIIVRRPIRLEKLINKTDEDGQTALMRVAEQGDMEQVLWLLDHGADATLKDRKGETAYQLARRWGHDDIAAVIQINTWEQAQEGESQSEY
ncbi:uncharacterized protein F4812DRAFT_453419 [Daldinia caldariorum]|uniref:uncharacterized protein n=1 Tax=Daldinia caldariorum TaxID=326644 RepID=UPI00200802BD|nr:uncharacterized protein F4812DRAFT_453419 [Daldinia caldariorum]KAI1463680.1 hypothetical protein F4812DRAFT_453419 [Daldinia caldariorum]